MDIFVGILVFVAVVFIAALVFGGWLIVATVRLIGRALGGGAPNHAAPGAPTLPHLTRCEHAGCLAANPRQARFCRRCGSSLGVRGVREIRRVAIL